MSNLPKLVKKTLADVLLQEGIVAPNQLTEALDKQKFGDEPLGPVLLQMGIISELELARAYCKQFNLPFVDASRYNIAKEVTDLISVEEMQQNHFIILDKIGKVLLVAVSDVPSVETIEAWEARTGSVIFAFVTTPGQLTAAIQKSYFKQGAKSQTKSQAAVKHPTAIVKVEKPAKPAAGSDTETHATTSVKLPLQTVFALAKPGSRTTVIRNDKAEPPAVAKVEPPPPAPAKVEPPAKTETQVTPPGGTKVGFKLTIRKTPPNKS